MPERAAVLLAGCLALVATDTAAQADAVQLVQKTPTGLDARLGAGHLRLEAWGDGVVPVRFAAGNVPARPSFAVIGKSAASQWTRSTTDTMDVLSMPRNGATWRFNIGFVDDAHGQGAGESQAIDRVVDYTGAEVIVTASD